MNTNQRYLKIPIPKLDSRTLLAICLVVILTLVYSIQAVTVTVPLYSDDWAVGSKYVMKTDGTNSWAVKDNGQFVSGSEATDSLTTWNAVKSIWVDGDSLIIRNGNYKFSDTPVIDKAILLRGESVIPIGTNQEYADVISDLKGTVFEQQTGGKNALNITVVRKAVIIENLGLTWASSLRNMNTGNGLDSTPPIIEAPDKRDHGVIYGSFKNIFVWGTDGNHYSYWFENPLLDYFENIHAVGTGWGLKQSHPNTVSGNSLFANIFVDLMNAGTASDGFKLYKRTGATSGLTLFTVINLQVNNFANPANSHVNTVDGGGFDNLFLGLDVEGAPGGTGGGTFIAPKDSFFTRGVNPGYSKIAYDIALRDYNVGASRLTLFTSNPPGVLGTSFKGVQVSVTQGTTTKTVLFSANMIDVYFDVFIMPNWNTTVWITGRTIYGFDISFGTAAPANATIDWWVVANV